MTGFANAATDTSTQKVALITGASSGIGKATAEHLARAGVRVALAARREDELQQLKNDIESEGGHALVVQTVCTDSLLSLLRLHASDSPNK